jgi:hypothetical protein
MKASDWEDPSCYAFLPSGLPSRPSCRLPQSRWRLLPSRDRQAEPLVQRAAWALRFNRKRRGTAAERWTLGPVDALAQVPHFSSGAPRAAAGISTASAARAIPVGDITSAHISEALAAELAGGAALVQRDATGLIGGRSMWLSATASSCTDRCRIAGG